MTLSKESEIWGPQLLAGALERAKTLKRSLEGRAVGFWRFCVIVRAYMGGECSVKL